MPELQWDAWLTLAVLALTLAGLASNRLPADVGFVGAVTILLLAGVLTPAEAFGGLVNEGVMAVGALYLVVAGIRDSGAIQWLVRYLLGFPRSAGAAAWRLCGASALLSAFINNTPVVAMLMPAVSDWGRRLGVSASRLLMPLSFATMLGGMCTLIGTSTNLVVNGLLIDATGHGLGLFSIAPVGVAAAVGGIAVLVLLGPRLIPERRSAMEQFENVREYTLEVLVETGGAIDGLTIDQAGLRHVPGCFLAEIVRDGEVIAGAAPHRHLRGGDRLVFVGAVQSIVTLQQRAGLKPANDQIFKLTAPERARRMVEAVVAPSSPVAGRTVRDAAFRTRYHAVLLAVSRQGERVAGRVGDIELQAGDTLLLEAAPAFLSTQRFSRDFLLVREIGDSQRPDTSKARTALLVLAAMATSASLGLLSMLQAALLAGGLMVLTRCLSISNARASVDWTLLLTIGSSIGLGVAFQKTGLAALAAGWITSLAAGGAVASVAAVFVGASLLSLLVTNNAAAALVFPVALAVAEQSGTPLEPLAIACMLGASASFMTPYGYQTNLMVMGPGGYHFSDYLRLGGVLTVVVAIIGVAMISALWL